MNHAFLNAVSCCVMRGDNVYVWNISIFWSGNPNRLMSSHITPRSIKYISCASCVCVCVPLRFWNVRRSKTKSRIQKNSGREGFYSSQSRTSCYTGALVEPIHYKFPANSCEYIRITANNQPMIDGIQCPTWMDS